MNTAVKNLMGLSFLLSVAFVNFGYAAPPTAQEYIELYNEHKGFFLRDHSSAKAQLKEKFTEVALSDDFSSDLSAFYAHTLGQFTEYRENRSCYKKFEDIIVTSSSESSVLALNEFVTEKAQQALTAMSEGKHESDDRLVHSLIQSGLSYELIGIKAHAVASINSNQSSSLPKYVTAAVVGVSLYWFGPAYLMVGTQQLFPYVWTYLFGSVPAVGSVGYLTTYMPAMWNATGFVYSHSTAILCGAWALGSTAGYSACLAAQYGSELAHRGITNTYNYFIPVKTPATENEDNNDLELGLIQR